jgi:hypothetical protein
MEWDLETRRKLAREIRRVSLRIQEEEFAKNKGKVFAEGAENTINRIMEKLTPLGFEPANKDWKHDGELQGASISPVRWLYQDSPTHLWFETAQCRIVKIEKSLAEKVLVLGIP